MQASSDWLFGTQGLAPHGFCLLWRPELIALHVVSDALIALAYFAIPLGIWSFVHRRSDLEPSHRRIALLFVLFITACGLTHVASIATLWAPYYGVEGLLKAWTALVSVVTAVALPMLIPRLLKLPSPRTLQTANADLQAEVLAHRRTLEALEQSRADLERQVAERTEELRRANQRFQGALANSLVTVYEQDENLNYTWVFNPIVGPEAEQIVGSAEAEVYPELPDDQREFKRESLATGEPRQQEIRVVRDDITRWFDVRVEPITLANGRRGLIGASTDISALKRQQEHLSIVMSELNHRSKNLLTIVQVIAEQSASGLEVPRAYFDRFGGRLRSLSQAHDLLIHENWGGADLRAVIESQIQHQLETHPDRIHIDGAPHILPAQTAHYLAMAFHELAANASKYGALSGPTGHVEVKWRVEGSPDGACLRVDWRERGGPQVVAPERNGFGRKMLETIAPMAAGGSAELTFAADGVRWSLTVPLQAREAA